MAAPASQNAATGRIDTGKQQRQWAEQCSAWDEWDKAGPPYRIHANSYYVGTCGISAILITGSEGHILIDTGTEKGAEIVRANVEALGFAPKDIRIILSSHEHFDHVGGFALMQQWTGAKIIAAKEAASVLETGQNAPDDPQYGALPAMTPVEIAGTIGAGDVVTLGNLKLTPIPTPGHTPGALSWRWESCEQDECLALVYADSLSPVSSESYKFGDHPEYVAAYRAAIERIAEIKCDILLTPHPSASGMEKRLASPAGLREPGLCQQYAASISARLDKRLEQETGNRDAR
ncbi:MAG: subclass B3 metallo-beta-lactamase [Blastomonas sp.]